MCVDVGVDGVSGVGDGSVVVIFLQILLLWSTKSQRRHPRII